MTEWERYAKIAHEQAELFNNKFEEGYTCERCKGKGFIMSVVTDNNELYPHTVVKPCNCLRTKVINSKVEQSGIKPQIKNKTFETYTTEEEWQRNVKGLAEEYVNSDKEWFYICGTSGSGKTHICVAITNELLQNQHTVLYMLWRDVIGRLKRLSTSPEYDTILDKYKNTEILYIDDFLKTANKAKPTDADIQIAFELINYRELNNLKTIVSSEFELEEVLAFDEATGSRIFNKADKYYIKLLNVSNYRLKQK